MLEVDRKSHGRFDSRCGVLAVLVGLALCAGWLPGVALAQTSEPLRQPYEIAVDADDFLLETSLKVKKLQTSYEYWEKIQSDPIKCFDRGERIVELREYGYPNPRDGSVYACNSDYCYDFPGPTYRIRKPGERPIGDAYHLTLYNELPVGTDDVCNIAGTPYDWDEAPNCFHGEDITNHHFHGFHVSPGYNESNKTYQDYIYVKIYPDGSSEPENFPSVQVGSAEYQLSHLTREQHEGTHWYHPHKHGSTAQQLGNGMAGAFIVEGPYDQWIEDQVCRMGAPGCMLKEQLLVVQEILSDFGFVSSPGGDNPPYPPNPTTSDKLVNGQLYPTVSIAPGEVQRWRVLNAAMKAGAAFYFTFPVGLEVMQIGMDGVPFVKGNYDRQPLLGWTEGGSSCVLPGDGSGSRCILLHPGNRADFMVQRPALKRKAMRAAPKSDLEAGAVSLIHQRPFFAQKIRDRTERPTAPAQPELKASSASADDPTCPGTSVPAKPGLFRLNDCSGGGPGCQVVLMEMPDSSSYPSMPSLDDIDSVATTRTIPYRMQGYTGAQFTTSGLVSPELDLINQINAAVGTCRYLLPEFTIDGRQFAANSIDYTMALGTSEEWVFPNSAVAPDLSGDLSDCPGLSDYVTNEGCPGGVTPCLTGTVNEETVTMALPVPPAIQHPVHIHVNPFQVRTCADGRKCGPPYVWQDVMGLNLPGDSGNATMRTTFEGFTGEFVMHCHILGHEDRGMMQNLEVCEACPAK